MFIFGEYNTIVRAVRDLSRFQQTGKAKLETHQTKVRGVSTSTHYSRLLVCCLRLRQTIADRRKMNCSDHEYHDNRPDQLQDQTAN